jgi:hypothetical protein
MGDGIQRRVVCAAVRNPKGDLVLGARHFDGLMHKTLNGMPRGQQIEWGWCLDSAGPKPAIEQGFIDQWGAFMTREEALGVALAAGQRIRRCGGDERRLFSENLY